MPIKLRKIFSNGQNREEQTNVLEIGLGVTLSQASDGIPRLDVNGAGAFVNQGTIAVGGTLTPDWSNTSAVKAVVGSSVTIAAPLGAQDGGTYIMVIRTGVSAVTPTWNAAYLFPGANKPSFPANAVNVVTFICEGSTLLGVSVTDFR